MTFQTRSITLFPKPSPDPTVLPAARADRKRIPAYSHMGGRAERVRVYAKPGSHSAARPLKLRYYVCF